MMTSSKLREISVTLVGLSISCVGFLRLRPGHTDPKCSCNNIQHCRIQHVALCCMMLDVVERSLLFIKHRLQHHPIFLLFLGVKNNVAFVWPPNSTLFDARTPTKVTLRLSVSLDMVYSSHQLRALPRQFNLQNAERAKF